MAYFGNAMQGWDYIMYLAEKTGDWELYEFAKRMKEEEEKWEPKVRQL